MLLHDLLSRDDKTVLILAVELTLELVLLAIFETGTECAVAFYAGVVWTQELVV